MPSLDPPIPVLATISLATSLVTITFNHPLVAGPLNFGNWSIITTAGGPPLQLFPITIPTAAGNDVTWMPGGGVPVPPDNIVNYQPPPFDVLSDFGFVEAAAFALFPLTIIA